MAKIVSIKRDIGRFYRVRFTADEIEALRLAFRGLPEPETLIEEVRFACDCAMGKQPDRANRTKRLEKLHAAVADFEGTLHEVQEFALDHLQIEGRKNEIAATASQILSHLIRLESLLDSRKTFKRFHAGRRHNERALVLARGVRRVFERFELPVSADRAGLYHQALCITLAAIQTLCKDDILPASDPSRLIKQVMDETCQK